jgi:ABC-2 type transport system ATP-binding protein
MLILNNVSLTLRDSKILNNITCEVNEGDIFCILGKNGSGKSVLSKTILGLYPNFEGEILINQINIKNKSRASYLSNIGALIESAALYLNLSAYENLLLISKYYPKKKITKNRIKEVLEIVGLSDEATKNVKLFSQGMKQKLGLGIAILHEPSLIILDEPSNALDPEAILQLHNLILKLNNELNCTFLINTHNLPEAVKLAKKMIILKKGELVYESIKKQKYTLISGTNTSSEVYQSVLKEKSVGYFSKGQELFFLFDEKPSLTFEANVGFTSPSIEDIFLALHQSVL